MSRTARETWSLAGAALLSVVLVGLLDLATNSLDTTRFSWDFRYYIRMAERPFAAPLASPFAYRYGTPLLVHVVATAFNLTIEHGYRTVALTGAGLQLLGIFLLSRWFTRSSKGGLIALLVTGFSLFNVKFLLFDVYRPDHLAYGFLILQTYFALERRFWPLLFSTLVASQLREFNIIPLVAYLTSSSASSQELSQSAGRRTLLRESLISGVVTGAAVFIPRFLIPVAEDYQFASFTRDGILRVLLAPLVLSRDANFLYSVAAYLLPSLMIAGPTDAAAAFRSLQSPVRRYLIAYSVLVLLLSFLGGTDFYRFSSFLFIPQAIFVGLMAKQSACPAVGTMLLSMAVFNRLWLPFPMSDVGTYLDFYGGFGTRFGWPSVLRILECLAFIAIGVLVRMILRRDRLPSPPATG